MSKPVFKSLSDFSDEEIASEHAERERQVLNLAIARIETLEAALRTIKDIGPFNRQVDPTHANADHTQDRPRRAR